VQGSQPPASKSPARVPFSKDLLRGHSRIHCLSPHATAHACSRGSQLAVSDISLRSSSLSMTSPTALHVSSASFLRSAPIACCNSLRHNCKTCQCSPRRRSCDDMPGTSSALTLCAYRLVLSTQGPEGVKGQRAELITCAAPEQPSDQPAAGNFASLSTRRTLPARDTSASLLPCASQKSLYTSTHCQDM
jgi:hypothetical protein